MNANDQQIFDEWLEWPPQTGEMVDPELAEYVAAQKRAWLRRERARLTSVGDRLARFAQTVARADQ